MRLNKKIIIIFASIAFFSLFLAMALSNIFLKSQFEKYVIKKQDKKSLNLIYSLSKCYSLEHGWDKVELKDIGIAALEDGMIIKITDREGKVIWDAKSEDGLKCQRVIKNISDNMEKVNINWTVKEKGKYKYKDYNLEKDKVLLGKVTVGNYSPYYYRDEDILFLNELNKLFLIALAIALLISIIVGTFLSKGLTKPLLEITEITHDISKGNYNKKIKTNTNTYEIKLLAESVNNLGDDLERQKYIRKKLTKDISHELRTPITTVLTYMEALKDGVWEPSQEKINICYEELRRLDKLVGDVEKITKCETTAIEFKKETCSLKEIYNELHSLLKKELKLKDISLNFKGKDVNLLIDKNSIVKAFSCILLNSVQYSPKESNISIEATEKNNKKYIYFIDKGKGISEEDLPYVFERFYKSDKSRNRSSEGFGIGLTIAKYIVNAHNGEIKINSKLGEGTTVTVIL
ncbi:HAMP domain-containing histidine kinase [Clostridium sp. MSJ-4]|uniref:histidine kinase n=1 Tax=Clostridium simiarum TaxID=2841506 RepID=A0ABS6EVZ6_9CLOT|nr:HAMP domain-containing sensor histidine kinase [Clostridium simiarum]MBU5590404.1 HAMP domain-containing histidine kinase [Clostridium simiarum]